MLHSNHHIFFFIQMTLCYHVSLIFTNISRAGKACGRWNGHMWTPETCLPHSHDAFSSFHLLPLPLGLHGTQRGLSRTCTCSLQTKERSPALFPVLLTFFVPYFSRNSKPELEDRASEKGREREGDGSWEESPISPSPQSSGPDSWRLGKYKEEACRGRVSRIQS